MGLFCIIWIMGIILVSLFKGSGENERPHKSAGSFFPFPHLDAYWAIHALPRAPVTMPRKIEGIRDFDLGRPKGCQTCQEQDK